MIQFHAIRSDSFGQHPLIAVRVHEQTHARTRFPDLCHDRFQSFRIGMKIPSVIRSEGGRVIRNQRALGGADSSYDFQKIRIWISFDVEFDIRVVLEKVRKFVYIRRSDVPLVGTGMHGDTVSSCGDASALRRG